MLYCERDTPEQVDLMQTEYDDSSSGMLFSYLKHANI